MTEEECQALYLGCNFILDQKDFPLSKASERVIEKISNLLPKDKIDSANSILNKIKFNLTLNKSTEKNSEILHIIKEAINTKKTVHVKYKPIYNNEITEREVDIFSLSLQNNAWYVDGYCHLRSDRRQFKVDRIQDITITKNDSASNVTYNKDEKNKQLNKEPIVIKVLKDTITGRKVKENPILNECIDFEDDTYINLKMCPNAFTDSYVINILLNLGKDAELISPDYLRLKYLDELKAIINKY